MITEKEYLKISDEVYAVESKKVFYPFREGDYVAEDKFYILKVEDNVANGMQAMAVAPVVDGKADTSQNKNNMKAMTGVSIRILI